MKDNVNNKKKQKKERIFKAALLQFSIDGYENTSMDQIAIKSDVAKGTLYYYFKNKEELFKYILEEGINILYKEVHKSVENITDPLEKIVSICEHQIKTALANKAIFKMLISELWGKQISHQYLKEQIKKYIIEMSKIIEEGQKQKHIKPGNPLLMSYNIFGAFISTGIYEIINTSIISEDEIIKNSIDFMLNGICE